MYKIIYILVLFLCLSNCEVHPTPTAFSDDALKTVFVNIKGEQVALKTILEAHKGKTIVLDVWASWCKDCIVGLPNLKALQADYKDVVYLFLSMDKTQKRWKKSIIKYAIVGEHYFMPAGWKGPFSDFIDLDWVPRYMVIDGTGDIKLFKAIDAKDPNIRLHLN